MTDKQSHTPPDPAMNSNAIRVILYLIDDWKWKVILMGVKALIIVLVWNNFLTALALPELKYGQAFAIVFLVTVLFSNLNGYSKYQTGHLADIKHLLNSILTLQALLLRTQKSIEILSDETEDVDNS